MSNTIREQFSSRFKLALNEAGYGNNQLNELGRLFNVSPQAVRKWLHAEAIPNSSRAPDIAKVLGVRRAWLLDGEDPMRPVQFDISEKPETYQKSNLNELSLSSNEFRLIKNYRKLSSTLRGSVDSMLENINKEVGE